MPLLTDELKVRLPPLYSQEGETDPVVRAHFYLPGTRWHWWAMEGEPKGDDFLFFGFVNGQEDEFGYFRLSELESVRLHLVIRVERDLTFQPGRLTDVVPAPDV
jgi:hypothetical protein